MKFNQIRCRSNKLKQESTSDKSEINRVNGKFKQIIFPVRKNQYRLKPDSRNTNCFRETNISRKTTKYTINTVDSETGNKKLYK